MPLIVLTCLIAIVVSVIGASAEEAQKKSLNDITFYGGVMVEGDFPGDSLIPLGSPLTDVHYLSAAYNREFLDFGEVYPYASGFHLGGEFGLAARFGDDDPTAELWFGPSLRYQGINLGPVNFSIGAVGGLSFVDDPIGIEADRELWSGGDADLLYYAGVELGVSLADSPSAELVIRNHHRSGGKNISYLPTIGDMGEASNTNTIGLRLHF